MTKTEIHFILSYTMNQNPLREIVQVPCLTTNCLLIYDLSDINDVHARRQHFQNFKPFRNPSNRYQEIATRTWPKNENVYAICCRPEADDEVISGRNVKTPEGYIVAKFDVISFNSFRDFPKRSLCDGSRSYRFVERQKCMSDGLHNREWSTWIAYSKFVNLFDIAWTVIEKLRPKHDPIWTRLCDLLPTESRCWRHLWLKYKEYLVLLGDKFWMCWHLVLSEIFQRDYFVTVKSVTAAVAWQRMTSFPVHMSIPSAVTLL